MDGAAIMAEAFTESIRFARSVEKMAAVVGTVGSAIRQVADVQQHDPDLAPELRVAVDHLHECGEALQRAVTFADARLSARMEELLAS